MQTSGGSLVKLLEKTWQELPRDASATLRETKTGVPCENAGLMDGKAKVWGIA